MPMESQDSGTFVYGYLDTGSTDRRAASDTVLVTATAPYAADLRPEPLGLLNSCDIRGDTPVRVSPHARTVARDAGTLGLLLSGGAVLEQDGRNCPVAPGEFVLYSGDRPYRLDLTGRHRWFVLSLDPATARMVCGGRDLTANPRLPGSPLGRVLGAMLAELAECTSALGPLTRSEMGEHLGGLVRTLARSVPYRETPAPPLFDRIVAHIDRNLQTPLTPAAVAACHHMSVRSLHALFSRHGETLGDLVRRHRLDRIRRDLLDPAQAHVPAYAVAARWGLPDASHFSKAFRAEFGLSPRELRSRHRYTQGAGVPAHDPTAFNSTSAI
ncbi:helix-turn-helix domain-containing protein [Streptomyces sp. NPDC050145]|uniref:helix-turn-helix domain-containing protein n=1 Tax=Streptomyces sp. NPDC050145 TaxID=3365602 RepID=UPI0037B5D8BD